MLLRFIHGMVYISNSLNLCFYHRVIEHYMVGYTTACLFIHILMGMEKENVKDSRKKKNVFWTRIDKFIPCCQLNVGFMLDIMLCIQSAIVSKIMVYLDSLQLQEMCRRYGLGTSKQTHDQAKFRLQ